MKLSKLYAPTLKEDPANAEVISHQLMLRAGLIRKLSAGIYTYLPLGQRVVDKFSQIVKEEMNKAGGQELLLPALQPAELWRESGRFENYGPELMKLKDRHDRDFCLGPTHEEVITDLVRDEVRSYKDLPLNLYQIQTKYRDEIRPRFGVLRGREFIMKDAYSFDQDEAGLDESYQQMYQAYENIFSRCGLEFKPVKADTGTIGGDTSHEFMVLADAGEDTVVYCPDCDYAANLELAEAESEVYSPDEELAEIKEVATPDAATIADVADYLKTTTKRLIKAVLYKSSEEELILALVRGDYEVNQIKLANLLDVVNLELLAEDDYDDLETVKGYTGPVDLAEVKIVADDLVMELTNAITGANQADMHLENVNPGRDFEADIVADIREVKAGEACLECGSKLEMTPGIEVGQVFKLGTKYSEPLEATYLDENGKAQPMVMGCYGIGITRTVAAAIEQNYDDYGIKWPKALAPYTVHILTLGQGEVEDRAEELYAEFKEAGIEVLYDDRNERAGFKFNDADLIGCPINVIIGSRSLQEGKLEIKLRQQDKKIKIDDEAVVEQIQEFITKLY